MRKIDPYELGGTLFSPASHKNLQPILQRKKLPHLQSVVIDFEDGLSKTKQLEALEILKHLLDDFTPNDLFVFIRPASIEMLESLLRFKNIEKIDGFVLPKFSLQNAKAYLSIVKNKPFYIMPSLESSDMFIQAKLEALREIFDQYKKQILLIRIGCEDMFKMLRLKRQRKESVFDRSISAHTILTILATFLPFGYRISGCVYPDFSDIEGFKEDIKKDFLQGMVSKTIIHPHQIEPLKELYKVTQEELDFAQKILQTSEAVFNHEGAMAEKNTQSPYANDIVLRAKIYGVG